MIRVELRDPWTLHPERLKLPIGVDDCILYDNGGASVIGQVLLDAIGLPRKEICFVKVNGGKYILSRKFVELDINDDDFVAIYPFSIAG